jgi:hypothetical protein
MGKYRIRIGPGPDDHEPDRFVGSRLRNRFHCPDCQWALAIAPANRIEFRSHADAVAKGKKPCQSCKA